MSKKSITASQTQIINNLFMSKGWAIDNELELKISTYNKYVDRYGRIPPKTRDLFLELTERFDRIEINEVYKLFCEAYNSIPKESIEKCERIYILPLVEPQIVYTGSFLQRVKFAFGIGQLKVDRPKTKSGDRILTVVKSANYLELDQSGKFEFPSSFSDLKSRFQKNKDLLILIDDFIGSGDTANKILKQFFKEKIFEINNTIIISLLSMKHGVESVYKKAKIKVYYSMLQGKAITDFYKPESKVKENINLVKTMEKSINIEKRISLGYKKSEALTSIMKKSPNNTLPIFWYETNSIPAPFPRENKFK